MGEKFGKYEQSGPSEGKSLSEMYPDLTTEEAKSFDSFLKANGLGHSFEFSELPGKNKIKLAEKLVTLGYLEKSPLWTWDRSKRSQYTVIKNPRIKNE